VSDVIASGRCTVTSDEDREWVEALTGPPYRTIVADPPWPFQWAAGKGGRRRREAELGYKTMTVAEISELPIGDFADPEGCHLFLWATDEMYREGEAVRVARAWGFEPCGPTVIWRKPNFGLGVFPRPQHEPLLVCRRGSITFKDGANKLGSVQDWPLVRSSHNGGRVHSAKPDASLDCIEAVAHAPRVELFARRARFGWDYWGDESLGTAALAGVKE
jgi:N6-adenosine-specific RNA methylase IME4